MLDNYDVFEYNIEHELEDELMTMNDDLEDRLKKRFKQKYNTQKPVKWAIIQSRRLFQHSDVQDILEEWYGRQRSKG